MRPSQPNPKLTDSLAFLRDSKHLGVLTGSAKRPCDANDALLQMIGFTREQMERGEIDWGAIFPGFPLDERHLQELRTNGTIVPYEKECVCPDGTRLPVLIGGVRLSSRPLGWVCWVVNLRATKEIAKAEQQSRELQVQLDAELRGASKIHEIATRLLSKSSVSEVLNEILNAAIEVTEADLGNIQLLDQGSLNIVAQRGFSAEFLTFFQEVSHDTVAACAAALRGPSRVIIEDVETNELFRGTPAGELVLRAGVRAVQSTPLVGPSGEIYGILSTHFRKSGRPGERALRYLDLLASQAGQALERLQYFEMERRGERLKTSAELASSLAHEINNPAQALTNVLMLLSQHEGLDREGKHLVRMATEQLSRMSETVRKILAVDFKSTGTARLELTNLIQHMRVEETLRAKHEQKAA